MFGHKKPREWEETKRIQRIYGRSFEEVLSKFIKEANLNTRTIKEINAKCGPAHFRNLKKIDTPLFQYAPFEETHTVIRLSPSQILMVMVMREWDNTLVANIGRQWSIGGSLQRKVKTNAIRIKS